MNKKSLLKEINRRTFVKNTALATGGILTFPMMGRSSMIGTEDVKLKIAVVGCGGRGSGAAVQALKADKNNELVSMADAFSDRLESSLTSIKEHFEGERTIDVKPEHRFVGFDAYKKAIDLADVVILTTPPGFRPYHFEYAIAQNKHVFMEKPVATDPVGVRKVLEVAKIAKAKKLSVMVGLQRHYQQKYLDLYQQVQDGAIGKITSGQVYWNSGGVWVSKRKPEQTELEYQMRNWYYFNWLCGDHILEQHIHNIDVANWFIGEFPISAQGMGGRQVRNGIDHGEIFDHHFVEFTYPGGAIISSQCRHQPDTFSRVDEMIIGTKGSFTANSGLIKDHNGKELFKYNEAEDEPDPYQVEHDILFAAIRKKELISDAEHAAKSTLTAIMGRMATYSGKVITWDDAMNSDMKLMPETMTWESVPPVLPNEKGQYAIASPGITNYSNEG